MKKLFTLFTAMLVGAAMGFAADVEYTIQGNDQGAPKAGEVLRTQGTAVTMTANQDGSSNKGVVSGATFADGTVGTSLCSKSTQMRMSSAPDADNLAGTPNGAGCVSYTVVITKPVTNFKVYFEAAGTSRSVNLYNQSTGDKITIAGETNEVAMGGTNNGFVATEASVAPGTYTLYATGFGGGFMGVKYTVTEEGGEEPGGEEPGDFYGTLFHWQSDGNAISTGTTVSTKGGTLTIDGTANPSTESAAYAADVPDDMKSTGKNALKLGTNTLYAGLKLDKALKAGDIIYICGYNPYKVGTNVSGNAATTDIAASLETGSGKSDYQVAQVVVPASAEGATTLYLSRAKG
ncbi:MAG: hypothetical protein J1E63_07050, partial [Muribaculaceae bacterium]|nr:hypothetical protein [Muribaculaceae bacterium]